MVRWKAVPSKNSFVGTIFSFKCLVSACVPKWESSRPFLPPLIWIKGVLQVWFVWAQGMLYSQAQIFPTCHCCGSASVPTSPNVCWSRTLGSLHAIGGRFLLPVLAKSKLRLLVTLKLGCPCPGQSSRVGGDSAAISSVDNPLILRYCSFFPLERT